MTYQEQIAAQKAAKENQIKKMIKWGLGAVIALILVITFFGTMERNDDQNWQIVQYPWGSVEVVDKAGYYPKWFGSVWTYPRNMQFEFTKEKTPESPTDESTRVTFNDGGTAEMDVMIRVATPLTVDAKRSFHRLFGGNQRNVKDAIWGHIANVLKATGPLMSASEHQSSRKAEFTQLATQQLDIGLFEMRRIEKVLKDQFDEKGNPITIFATEIVTDQDGKPRVAQISPYAGFGITVQQFSITESEYDEQTRKQFAQKKDSFLKAESAKAQREQEVQQRLMIQEQGLREKAEFEAKANKEKAAAVIEAQKQKEVAELKAQQEKVVAETAAAQQLAVAKLEKEKAETEATKVLEVAKLNKQTADQDAAATIVRATAEKEKIALAGAITEKERVLAEIAAQRDVNVADKLSKIGVPQFVITGSDSKGGEGLTSSLVNIRLLEASGLLNMTKTAAPATSAAPSLK